MNVLQVNVGSQSEYVLLHSPAQGLYLRLVEGGLIFLLVQRSPFGQYHWSIDLLQRMMAALVLGVVVAVGTAVQEQFC